MKTEDTEAFRRRRAKPSKIKARYSRPTCKTARTTVHHYNGRKYCSTETVLLTFPFFQTNIVSQMWPSGGKGWVKLVKIATTKNITEKVHSK